MLELSQNSPWPLYRLICTCAQSRFDGVDEGNVCVELFQGLDAARIVNILFEVGVFVIYKTSSRPAYRDG